MKILSVAPDPNSELVMLAEQVGGFRVVRIDAVDPEGRRIALRAVATESGYECEAVSVEGEGRPITGEVLRRIPIRELLGSASSMVYFKSSAEDPGEFFDMFRRTPPPGPADTLSGDGHQDLWKRWPDHVMREWPHGDLGEVHHWTALTYALAAFHGLGPTKSIREAAGVGQTTAGRLIRSARDAGVLTTPPPTRTGGARSRVKLAEGEADGS